MSRRWIAGGWAWLVRRRVRVGTVADVDISLHWAMGPAVVLWFWWGGKHYAADPFAWAAAEGVGLVALVLLHEAGHVVAARRSGWAAREVILWPGGGVTALGPTPGGAGEGFVDAAGPLVNLALVPVTVGLWWLFGYRRGGDLGVLLGLLAAYNILLLGFNLLPVWPLDGGRMLEVILRRQFGFARGGLAAAAVGVVTAVGTFIASTTFGYYLIAAIFLPLGVPVNRRLKWFNALRKLELRWGRHDSAFCPHCGERPVDMPGCVCAHCGERYNPLRTAGRCWACGEAGEAIPCWYCGERSAADEWEGNRVGEPAASPTNGPAEVFL